MGLVLKALFLFMKISGFSFLVFLLLCGSSSRAQSAVSSTENSKSVMHTVSNNSGFSIKNNGTLYYKSPLNSHYNSVKKSPTAKMVVDNQKYKTPDSLIDSALDNDNVRHRLSQDISAATIPSEDSKKRVKLGFTTTVPSVLSIKIRESLESRETVDSQSLSIFPSGFPSSF